ncbi:MAG TPA: class I SAM-dependent methyltransferase [Desulfuromonadaceae bacterium]|nr:class I SAM-dependent methyltransferase [Desulfuromonadaceae bacterium]
MYHVITTCRICSARELESVLNLGNQCFTGIFPKNPDAPLASAPLELVKCARCGLVQLHHNFEPSMLYGPTYGYRSGLNKSMVEHLRAKAAGLQKLCPLQPGDIVLDIGSNDGTSLGFYPAQNRRLGMDPSAEKFRKYYQPGVDLVVDFFSAKNFQKVHDAAKAKIVTSIAMFYDLESPPAFVEQIRDVLAPDGIWHLEQSYLPLMLKVNAYDTVCHEHLEYYALRQIKWMTDQFGLKIIDVQLNDINGGSFAVTVAHKNGPYPEATAAIAKYLDEEDKLGLQGLQVFQEFRGRVEAHREQLPARLAEIKQRGQLALGYGASTKGNVVLQYCNITPALLPAILEVNPDKFGCYTPGTKIPIISETEGHARNPDFLMVMPWHFKTNVTQRETNFLKRGGKLLFPLPEIHTV